MYVMVIITYYTHMLTAKLDLLGGSQAMKYRAEVNNPLFYFTGLNLYSYKRLNYESRNQYELEVSVTVLETLLMQKYNVTVRVVGDGRGEGGTGGEGAGGTEGCSVTRELKCLYQGQREHFM